MTRPKFGLVCLVLWAAVACDKKPASETPSSTPPLPEPATAQAEPSASAAVASSAPAAQPPGPTSGSEAERAAAVTSLISGEVSADGLPVVATEPGETLDPSLRSRLSPLSRVPVQLRVGQVTVKGDLLPEIVRRIVRRHYPRFRACYEKALATNPKLQGRVTLQLEITKDGRTKRAKSASSDLPDSGVVACIVRAASSTTFPESQSGSLNVASIPLLFSTQ